MNRPVAVTRRQLVACLVVIVGTFAAVAWNSQQNTAELRDYVHQACLSRAANAQRLNDQAAAFIAIERANPVAAQETIDARIAAYESGILVVPDCSDR